MKKLLFAVFFLTAATCVMAQQNLEANWQGHAIDGQHRTVNGDNPDRDLAIVGAGSFYNNVTNSSLTVNNKNISISNDTAAAGTVNPSGSKGAFVAGGAVWNATASGNTLNLTNMTGANLLRGRDAIGGAAVLREPLERFSSGSATNNTVNLNNVSTAAYNYGGKNIGGNVYGGLAEYSKGSASGNTVNITNGSQIHGDVFGGKVNINLSEEDLLSGDVIDSYANNNRVIINNSAVTGTVFGAFGAANSSGNTVIVENDSNIDGDVFAVDKGHGIADNDGSTVYAENNSVIIRNSTITGNAAALDTSSVNASGNTLFIKDSTVNAQSLYSVKITGNKVAGTDTLVKAAVGNNTLSLSGLTLNSLQEAGASLNLVGDASGNTVRILDSDITLSSPGKFFGGTLDSASLQANNLLTLPSDKGILFGGATMQYTSIKNTEDEAKEEAPEQNTVATYGTNSDNNTIILSHGTVNGNIIGGFAAYIDEQDYWTKTTTEGSEGEAGTTTITHVVKNGLNIETTIDPAPEEGQPDPDKVEKKEDLVFSASNNTIILDNATFNGTMYGGYVDGAELTEKNKQTQNNTVILRGNITLGNDSVISGGNNELYKSTNRLVFDRTKATFNNANQFQNFNQMWSINADYDTDIKFNFDGVYANMTVDPSAMKEGQATVVTTKTETDLTDIQQGDKIVDLTDSGITLNNNKLGIYSFDLSGIKLDGDTVGWQLTGTKKETNLEVYGQLPLVGLALAMEGQEMMSTAITDAWKNDNESNTFLNGGYHHTRYETGSGFDLDSGIVQAGAWKKFT
ncbi:MAG: hypothetical protein SPI69_06920, partial [Elusimicrobiaceae bacterium]|nr:hypothetical protein [Elusimicrobiaceae bacterium]